MEAVPCPLVLKHKGSLDEDECQETGGLCPDLRKPAAGCAHIKALKGPGKPDVFVWVLGGGGREENGECVVSLDAISHAERSVGSACLLLEWWWVPIFSMGRAQKTAF